MIDDLLKKFGVDRSTLTSVELDTLDTWAKALQAKRLQPEDITGYVNAMIDSISRELTGYEEPKSITSFLFRRKRHRSLEARLYNYIMLRDFLTSPEKAKKYVESQLKNLAQQINKIS